MLESVRSTPGESVGRTEPRLSTEPLRKLTRKTSLGFEAIEFIESVVGIKLLPWQKWWLIHALELLPGGRKFRFKTIVTLVARQNGKTTLLKCLTLYLMYSDRARMVLGSAQNLEIAKESWLGAVQMIEENADLYAELDYVRRGNGDQELKLTNGARYKIAAATGNAGRGLSVDLLILDELRQHKKWDAWGALSKTTMARMTSLTVCISNAGDDESVVLNTMRANALAGGDEALAIFEWSAPEDCELDDEEGWAAANPALGYTLDIRAIRSAMTTDPPAVFRTEILCQHVESMADAVVTAPLWESCLDRGMKLDARKGRTALCFDVALDQGHATLAAAQVGLDGKVRVTTVASWPSAREALADLAMWKDRIKPAAFGWFAAGPAVSVAADLKKLGAEAIQGDEVKAVCQEFAALVPARGLIHNGDGLLTAHVLGAKKYTQGDGWRFVRRGVGHVDAAYAAAGAVRLARTLPPPKRVMLVTPSK